MDDIDLLGSEPEHTGLEPDYELLTRRNEMENEPIFEAEKHDDSFYGQSTGNAVATPNEALIFVEPGYRFHTKSEIQAFVSENLAKAGEEYSFLDIYVKAKENELFIKETIGQTKAKALDGALSVTGGATGKVEHKGVDILVKNVANTYEYTGKVKAIEDEISVTINEMTESAPVQRSMIKKLEDEIIAIEAPFEAKLQQLKNSLEARKKYEESTDEPNEKAKIVEMGGCSLAITFKK